MLFPQAMGGLGMGALLPNSTAPPPSPKMGMGVGILPLQDPIPLTAHQHAPLTVKQTHQRVLAQRAMRDDADE